MKISIAARYRPFSHELGASCLLPRTTWVVEAFPALLRLKREEGCIEIPLAVRGPVREFTLQQDLEKGCVFVWGIGKQGRYRMKLEADAENVRLAVLDGSPLEEGTAAHWQLGCQFREGPALERLSLGSHRAQDWDLILRRFDLREILPILYHLSQWIPEAPPRETKMLALLKQGFEPFLRAGFYKLLCPRLKDGQYQGLVEDETVSGPPFAHLFAVHTAIRETFVKQQGSTILLPQQREFDCGRFVGIRLDGIGMLDLEWSKRSMRRAVLRTEHAGSIRFDANYRLRESMRERGRRVEPQDVWHFEPNQTFLLDRFQT